MLKIWRRVSSRSAGPCFVRPRFSFQNSVTQQIKTSSKQRGGALPNCSKRWTRRLVATTPKIKSPPICQPCRELAPTHPLHSLPPQAVGIAASAAPVHKPNQNTKIPTSSTNYNPPLSFAYSKGKPLSPSPPLLPLCKCWLPMSLLLKFSRKIPTTQLTRPDLVISPQYCIGSSFIVIFFFRSLSFQSQSNRLLRSQPS